MLQGWRASLWISLKLTVQVTMLRAAPRISPRFGVGEGGVWCEKMLCTTVGSSVVHVVWRLRKEAI